MAVQQQMNWSFWPLCINNGVSIAIAGSTGSGKTTDLAVFDFLY